MFLLSQMGRGTFISLQRLSKAVSSRLLKGGPPLRSGSSSMERIPMRRLPEMIQPSNFTPCCFLSISIVSFFLQTKRTQLILTQAYKGTLSITTARIFLKKLDLNGKPDQNERQARASPVCSSKKCSFAFSAERKTSLPESRSSQEGVRTTHFCSSFST